jgi:erythromycin esterase-like protein
LRRTLPLFLQLEPLRAMRGQPLLERAIGVVYRPDTERESHYFWANLSLQFDAVFHLDETEAVEPLDVGADSAFDAAALA